MKISGSETHTDRDLSALVDLTEYAEDALQIEYEVDSEFIDPQMVAHDLGKTLTRLYQARMKKVAREKKVEAAKTGALVAINRRYKLVKDCYVDTQVNYPLAGFEMIALCKFGKVLKCTTVEYKTNAKDEAKRFNLASELKG